MEIYNHICRVDDGCNRAIWCINNWFLSGYYQNYKIHTLEKGYRAIDAIIQDEVRNGESSLEDAQAELNSLERVPEVERWKF